MDVVYKSIGILMKIFTMRSQKKHICHNLVNKSVTANSVETATTITKLTYSIKKPWNSQPKPKMSNSFELLTGSLTKIKRNMKFYLIS